MDCVSLGRDFFLIRFSNSEGYDFVLRRGPWFIGGHYLAILPWEPYFKASKAKLLSVAVWVRLPKLPIEFYETSVLKEIRSVIGPVLRIDSFTSSETRGGYVRLCVQINLDKPLITSIRIGRLTQRVLYEGVSALCFSCGRLGHKKENYCYQVKEATAENEKQIVPKTNETKERTQSNTNYGPWMVVTRKKSVGRLGQTNGQIKLNQRSPINFKGNLDLSQEQSLEKTGKDLEKSHPSDLANPISETTRVNVAQNTQKDIEMGNEVECQEGSEQGANGRNLECANPIAKNWLGHMVQEKGGGDSRRGHSPNSSGTYRNSRMVQGRTGSSVETTIPHNSFEYQNWGAASRPQCVESHAQSMVEFLMNVPAISWEVAEELSKQ
ncbi:hypothetical protein CMV_030536 [Castanea mollissima]|nr:hypothetical protein CMV_030536 [Castanea mollissima]